MNARVLIRPSLMRLTAVILLVFGLIAVGLWMSDGRLPLADASASVEGRRVALVVGNSAYRVSPLRNPGNDAGDLARALRTVGFDTVLEVYDGDLAGMRQGLRRFRDLLDGAALGLFFYAGHGAQFQGENYLIPVDAAIASAADLDLEALSAQQVLRQMEEAGAAVNVIILDACRDNPFPGASRSGARGLARIERTPSSALIAFATAPGQVASDGTGRNSPYTAALLERLHQPVSLVELFNDVGFAVQEATRGEQIPWYQASPLPPVQLAAGTVPLTPFAAEPILTPAPPSLPEPVDNCLQAATDWARIKGTDDIDVLDAFITDHEDRCPRLTAIAMGELTKLLVALALNAEPPPPPPPPPEPDPEPVTVPPVQISEPEIVEGPAVAWLNQANEGPGPDFDYSGYARALAGPPQPRARLQAADGVVAPVDRSRLWVRAVPDQARIRIMNIEPRYADGIELTPGRYDIEVMATGFVAYRAWIDLPPGASVLSVELPPLQESPDLLFGADLFADGTPGPELVLIPGGRYRMGSPVQELGRDDNEAQRLVEVEPLWMGRFEVTFDEYIRFAEATGRPIPDDEGWGRGWRPVIKVLWQDAVDYTRWLSAETGAVYRLPTSAEWEHAARAGTTTARYWGDGIGLGQANCNGCGSGWDGHSTAPVGEFPPNYWGLYDMLGNVWEWTCSAYARDDLSTGERCSEAEPPSAIIRGGSWYSPPVRSRAAARMAYATAYGFSVRGFRVVREL